jgi:hypothetical protein
VVCGYPLRLVGGGDPASKYLALARDINLSGFYDRFWIRIAIVLSVLVIIIGFPIFQLNFDFPDSIIYALTLVLSIWSTYFISAYLLYHFK